MKGKKFLGLHDLEQGRGGKHLLSSLEAVGTLDLKVVSLGPRAPAGSLNCLPFL